jgi:hypothetical protein
MGMGYLPIPPFSSGFFGVFTPDGEREWVFGCWERLGWGHPPIPIHT